MPCRPSPPSRRTSVTRRRVPVALGWRSCRILPSSPGAPRRKRACGSSTPAYDIRPNGSSVRSRRCRDPRLKPGSARSASPARLPTSRSIATFERAPCPTTALGSPLPWTIRPSRACRPFPTSSLLRSPSSIATRRPFGETQLGSASSSRARRRRPCSAQPRRQTWRPGSKRSARPKPATTIDLSRRTKSAGLRDRSSLDRRPTCPTRRRSRTPPASTRGPRPTALQRRSTTPAASPSSSARVSTGSSAGRPSRGKASTTSSTRRTTSWPVSG
mmetsp:Transcript_27550/g.89008  ORF Transcript_27550/g.89008 Transcript_27550/m.89008 type:complete len:273 (-) Transcript_27550:316-1134(-)